MFLLISKMVNYFKFVIGLALIFFGICGGRPQRIRRSHHSVRCVPPGGRVRMIFLSITQNIQTMMLFFKIYLTVPKSIFMLLWWGLYRRYMPINCKLLWYNFSIVLLQFVWDNFIINTFLQSRRMILILLIQSSLSVAIIAFGIRRLREPDIFIVNTASLADANVN